MKKITLASIRIQNIRLIFDLLVNETGITRSELAQKTGLSLMTVGNIIDQLDSHKLIRRKSKTATAAGRKAELLAVEEDAGKLVILDLTARDFNFVVLGLDLALYYSSRNWVYEKAQSYLTNLENFLGVVKKELATACAGQDLLGLAVSVPGPYDAEADLVITKRIPELLEIRLKSLIREIVLGGNQTSEIFIDEDVKFAALANLALVPEYKDKTVFYIYIGAGVGGAITLGGQVVRGADSFAGDIGQVLYDQKTSFEEMISAEVFSRELAQLPAGKDSYSRLLAQYSTYIAQALYNVVWLIDPHAIIIECAYASQAKAEFLTSLQDSLSRRLPRQHQLPKLLLSDRPVKDAFVGAALVLRDRWLDKIVRFAG